MSINKFSVRFVRLQCQSKSAIYRVESPNFSANDFWEEVAQIHINLESKDYAFCPGRRWRHELIIPPKFHGLSRSGSIEECCDNLEPINVGHGYFFRRIRLFARYCIEYYNLPDSYPRAHFAR